MKKIVMLLLVFLSTNFFSFSQNENREKYSQVRITIKSDLDIKQMESAGLFLDHGINKPGEYFETWLSETEIKLLANSGVPFQITIDDWYAYYQDRQLRNEVSSDIKPIEGFDITHSIYGTMGGLMKWEEAIAKLDSMTNEYPNLVSAKFSIGNSYELRPMWTVRVTKNPEAPTGRPEIWYNGVTHAREPMGMMNVYYYLYWLLENYNVDPIATYILNNREIYFTPFINPDGYVYNQTTNPNGGGMWRKNRRGQGTDINRNFGTYNFWNSSNGGSSTSSSSDTYRGPSPFSEPETENFKNFVNSRNFKATLDYHTYGNLLIKPYAWCDPTPTPDNDIFNEFGNDIVADNNYEFGTPYQTVGYYVRGGDLDWIYSSDSTGHNHNIFGMTPEVGTSGFYATQAEIIPYSKMCLFMNKYMALVSGPYVASSSAKLNKQIYTPGEAGTFKVVFRNKGLANADNIKLEWTTSTGLLSIPLQVITKPSMAPRTSDSVSFSFTISPEAADNFALSTNLKIKIDDTLIVYNQNYNILIGNGSTVFNDDAEEGMAHWTVAGTWGSVATQYHSATHSFTDSPSGNYLSNTNNSLTLSSPIDASTMPALYLNFWHRYDTEATYDFCRVEVSNNNGASWQEIGTYDGLNTTWSQVQIDLSDYLNNSAYVKIRFRLTSDGSVQRDGWYVDDIKLIGYNQAAVPVEFTNFTANFASNSVVLNWSTATELNNNGFEVQRALVNENTSASYTSIGFVKGNGTTTEKSQYNFIDNSPVEGKMLYRLKQIDLDGSTKLTLPVEVTFNGVIDYALEQNYPNPFNPITHINYSVPEAGNVTIKVFNILGKEVATIVNGFTEAGKHKVEFSGSEFGSGIYFYTIHAGSFSKTLKMMLIK
ncbi:MAG: T9SS type A sorting domain-containing protein [Ignavibacteriaceae bacterium]|nr:T9SS type A sorting domain-containing protein [Ignavibacteriaceae bacterium]